MFRLWPPCIDICDDDDDDADWTKRSCRFSLNVVSQCERGRKAAIAHNVRNGHMESIMNGMMSDVKTKKVAVLHVYGMVEAATKRKHEQFIVGRKNVFL
jgi:hypothetical protein